MRPQEIVLYPLTTERSVKMIQEENKLIFIVQKKANKKEIARAVKELYEVEVEEVRTSIDRRGRKRALVRLKEGFSASDIAVRLGIL
ncbi:MAG: 50S ribosomal protein L23 [Candidatus Bathyarchaeia archaeon]|nr:50S ribosomal protein L23 [Candidatus Bathyarchaeota archaeon]